MAAISTDENTRTRRMPAEGPGRRGRCWGPGTQGTPYLQKVGGSAPSPPQRRLPLKSPCAKPPFTESAAEIQAEGPRRAAGTRASLSQPGESGR